MGSIAKALRRINYDIGAKGLVDALNERSRRNEEAQTVKAIGDAYTQWKQGQAGAESANQAGAELRPGGQVTNPFAPKPSQGMAFKGVNGLGIPSNTPSIPDIQTNQVGKGDAYQKALRNKNIFDTTIAPLLLRKSTSPEQTQKVNALSNLMTEKVNQLKPEERVGKSRDPFKSYGYDDNGEFIETTAAQPKPEPEKELGNRYERTFVKVVNGVPRTFGIVKGTGEQVDLGQAYKPGSGEDKDGYPDISKQLGETAEGIKKIKDLKSAKWDNEMGGYIVKGQDIGLQGNAAGDITPLTQEELNTEKEKLKQRYTAPLVEAIKKRDLNDVVEIISANVGDPKEKVKALGENATPDQIREVKKKHNELVRDHLKQFIQKNPSYKPEKEILSKYFELFLL
jgi:hypothetical protein